jgi:hypothetical protein
VNRDAIRDTIRAMIAEAEKAEVQTVQAASQPPALPAPVETIAIDGITIVPTPQEKAEPAMLPRLAA